MGHSNSSLNTFAECMAKYQHRHILRTEPCKPTSPHLTFGTMAHDVLYKAGQLRDAVKDGIIQPGEYMQVIPSEVLYGDLKREFYIRSWERYFRDVIKQVAKYENELIEDIKRESGIYPEIRREVRIQITVDQLRKMGYNNINQPLTGIIDLLLITPTHATIVDYKFSKKVKGQDTFDQGSQLPFYSLFVHTNDKVPLRNIRYGYIDIPKVEFGTPAVLKNGTLSRAKDQNVSQEMYAKSVKAVHEARGDYTPDMLEPGGYYYDAWCNMTNNKAAYLTMQWLDLEVYEGVVKDLFNAAIMIDHIVDKKMPFLKKYSEYTCNSCEYIEACKPWLVVGDK